MQSVDTMYVTGAYFIAEMHKQSIHNTEVDYLLQNNNTTIKNSIAFKMRSHKHISSQSLQGVLFFQVSQALLAGQVYHLHPVCVRVWGGGGGVI